MSYTYYRQQFNHDERTQKISQATTNETMLVLGVSHHIITFDWFACVMDGLSPSCDCGGSMVLLIRTTCNNQAIDPITQTSFAIANLVRYSYEGQPNMSFMPNKHKGAHHPRFPPPFDIPNRRSHHDEFHRQGQKILVSNPSGRCTLPQQ